jgi:hypothetical protein
VVRISCPNDAFSGILELEASPVEGQPLQQKDKKRRKRKAKKKLKKPKSLCNFSKKLQINGLKFVIFHTFFYYRKTMNRCLLMLLKVSKSNKSSQYIIFVF